MPTGIYKYLALLLAIFAAAQGLFVIETNDEIEMFRSDVRWYEFELMNLLDIALEPVRIEVVYPDGVRPLRDEDWKGKTGISHARFARKDPAKNRIIVELPSLAANSSVEMWFAFVGQRYGIFDFTAKTYLRGKDGEWRVSEEEIPILLERKAEESAGDTAEKPPVAVDSVGIPAEKREFKFEFPEFKSKLVGVLLAILIGINIVLVVLVIYSLVAMRNLRKASSGEDLHDFAEPEIGEPSEPADIWDFSEEVVEGKRESIDWSVFAEDAPEISPDEALERDTEPANSIDMSVEPESCSAEEVIDVPLVKSSVEAIEHKPDSDITSESESTSLLQKQVRMESLFERLERAEREINRDLFEDARSSSHKRLAELVLDNEMLKTRLRILREMSDEQRLADK